MRAVRADKGVAVGVRCSVYYLCGCAVAMLFIYLSPRSALDLSDDDFVQVLIAAADSARVMSILNATLAILLMVRFPQARKSPWLWIAIASALIIMLLTPAFQSA